jgi:hypothetical protein
LAWVDSGIIKNGDKRESSACWPRAGFNTPQFNDRRSLRCGRLGNFVRRLVWVNREPSPTRSAAVRLQFSKIAGSDPATAASTELCIAR